MAKKKLQEETKPAAAPAGHETRMIHVNGMYQNWFLDYAIGCGVTTGVGAVINTAKVHVGDNVVVFGLGGIGPNVLQGARLAGANKIIGVDINPDREEWGRRFGMTDFLNSKGMSREDVVAKIVAMTDAARITLLTQPAIPK